MGYQEIRQNILKRLSLRRSRPAVLSIEIDGDLIRYCAREISGMAVVKKGRIPIDQIAALKKEMISWRGKISTLCLLPRHLATLRFLRLPSLDPRELRSMAHYQIMGSLPFPETELLTDLAVVNQDPDNVSSNVLAVIVRSAFIEPYLKILDALGVFPDGFVFSSSCIHGWAPERDHILPSGIFVHSRSGWLTIDILQDGQWVRSRCVPYKEESKDIKKYADEIIKTLSGLDRGAPKPLPIFLFAGTTLRAAEAKKALELELGLPCFWNETGDADPGQEILLRAPLVDPKWRFDLLPESRKNLRRKINLKRQIVRAASWMIATGALTASFNGAEILILKHQISNLQIEIKKLEPEADRIKAILDRNDLTKAQTRPGASALHVLRELYRSAPENSSLTHFEYGNNQKFDLDGDAARFSDIAHWVSSMENSGLFSKVELKSTRAEKKGGSERIKFKVQGSVNRGP